MLTKKKSLKPIGIFDSGVGGLSTLKALKDTLPNEHFLYYGDLLNLPYGTKTHEFLIERLTQIIDFLSQSCKIIVIACNTASMIILRYKKHFTHYKIPIINVIEPVINALKNDVKNIEIISILATRVTIESGIYQHYIKELYPDIKINAIAPQEWVELIEKEDSFEHHSIKNSVEHYTKKLDNKPEHVIILGCTHFSFIAPIIKENLTNVRMLNSSIELIPHLKSLLEKQSMLNLDDKKEDQIMTSQNSPVYEKIVYSIVDQSVIIITNLL